MASVPSQQWKLFSVVATRQLSPLLRSLPSLVFLSVIVATLWFWRSLVLQEKAYIHQATELETMNIKYEISHQLQERVQAMERLVQRWERKGKPLQQEWEAEVNLLLKHYGAYQAIAWIDPEFQVRWLVPQAGNEAVKNLHLPLENHLRDGFEIARNRRQVISTQLIDLGEGGKGFIVYVPIFEKNQFSGIIGGVFRTQNFFDSLFFELDQRLGHRCGISIFQGNQLIYIHSIHHQDPNKNWSQSINMNLYGLPWQLSVWPEQGLLNEKQSLLPTMTLVAGFLMALLLSIAIYLAQVAQKREKKAQNLNEELQREIAQRQQVEGQLQATTSLQRVILDSVNYTIISTTLEGTILTFNARAERSLGYKAQEVIGKITPMTIHDPTEILARSHELSEELNDVIQPNFEVFVAQVHHRGWDEQEWTYIRKDGTRFPVLLSVTALRDSHHNINGFVMIGYDITERKRNHEILQQQHEWLEVTLASIADAVIATDTQARITFINPVAEILTGWLSEEALEQNIKNVVYLIHEKTRQPLDILIDQVLEKGSGLELTERGLLLARDGREIPVDGSLAPIRSRNGKLQGAVVILRNMYQRRQAENALRDSKEELQAIYGGMVDGILIADVKTRKFLRANLAICKILGYSESELLKLTLNDIHPPEQVEHIFAQLIDLLEQKIEYAQDTACLRKDGSIFFADVRAKQIIYKEKPAVICLFRDITERKQAEEDTRKALAKEKELNELKSRFISMASHEFRTPLSTILFSAGLLENYRSQWSEEKQLTHLHRIQKAVQRMTELLEDVLLVGKAEAGKLELNLSKINLEQFCYEIFDEIQLASKNQHHFCFISDSSCREAWVDPKILRHILTNLLSNAVKYSPQGGPIHFELSCINPQNPQLIGNHCTESEDNELVPVTNLVMNAEKFAGFNQRLAVFKIQDSGIGIPLKDQKHLFDTFYRASNVGSIMGTGLGLAIVKRCIELHGGELKMQSEVGVGTTFIVIVPLFKSVALPTESLGIEEQADS